MRRNWLCATVLLSASAFTSAQTGGTSPSNGQPVITPKNGQSADQLARDRYECHTWAKSQTGFDPSLGASQGSSMGPDAYNRALAACLEGRGYGVRYPAPSAPTPVASAPPTPARATTSYVLAPGPELTYHPFAFHIDGGYTVAAGATGNVLRDGPNAGFGLTWFPTSALPVGIRIDGSYSRFDVRHSLLDAGGYTHGHEDIYGGDADLQVDLAHRSTRNKLYVFGGAGWYRERTRLSQISYQAGYFCDFYDCGPGYGPVLTAEARTTSPWRTAWNAGFGWETALAEHASFFLEARYMRIAPRSSQTQFVPIRLGFRF